MRPIWSAHPVATRNVLHILSQIVEYAEVAGHRPENLPRPASLSKLEILLGPVGHEVRHHKALAVADIPAAYQKLETDRASNETTRWGLQLMILTGTRSSEARGARWEEFDISGAVWTIPAWRTKTRREFQVPLSHAALALIEKADALDTRQAQMVREVGRFSEWVFSSPTSCAEVDASTWAKMLRRLEIPCVAHGFRSSFRDWCGMTGVDHELAELSLGHAVKDATEAAYFRDSLLERRREVLANWARFCAGATERSPADGGWSPVPALLEIR